MKKLIFAASLFAASFMTSYAQDVDVEVEVEDTDRILSKRGRQILPEAGDYSISFDAAPFLTYFGNLISGAAAPAPSFLNGPYGGFNQSITGRYFTEDNMAYRGKLRIGLGRTANVMFVQDLENPSDPDALVEDRTTFRYTAIELAGGIEKRKGIGRVQGYYGGELALLFNGGGTYYTYGNEINANNAIPSRPLVTRNARTFGFGPRGFIGVEYFFAPKISVGAEYGWGLLFSKTGRSKTVTEGWDAADSVVEETESQGNTKSSSLILDTDINNAEITLNFYF